MTGQTGLTASSLTLTSNQFVRTGYTFAGWNTATDGKGTNYANAQENVTMPAGGLNLFTKWTATGGGLSPIEGYRVNAVTEDGKTTNVSATLQPSSDGRGVTVLLNGEQSIKELKEFAKEHPKFTL